jgi:hypothetical protein
VRGKGWRGRVGNQRRLADCARSGRDMSSTNNWDEIEPHIKRHESGCWTWDGSPVESKPFRVIAGLRCGSSAFIIRTRLVKGERKTPASAALSRHASKELTVAVLVSGKHLFFAHPPDLMEVFRGESRTAREGGD